MTYLLFLEYTKLALEIIAVSVIIFGIVRSIGYFFIACFYKHFSVDAVINEIRLKLSNYLVLSLEVLIGRDVVETLFNPSIDELIGLGAIIGLRSLLAFFLNYEMRHAPNKELLPKMFEKKT